MILDLGIRIALSLIFEDYYMNASPGRPTIAIVILNWNGRAHLEKFLPSVIASTYPAKEVIVADNASTDDSVPYLQETFPQLRIIRLDRNYGFAQGYNEALRQVQSDYYVLLNSDVEVEPGWIEPIADLMERDPSIGACQPKIRMWAHRERFEYAGAAGGWLDSLGYPFARGRVCSTAWGGWTAISLPIRRRSIFAGACNWKVSWSIPAPYPRYIMSAGVPCQRARPERCSLTFGIT
jgi:glycosyltransferase involved in cell wall biosynthesis